MTNSFLAGRKTMRRDFEIPLIYKKMGKSGLFNPETFLWMDDMKWIPLERISEYDYQDGESKSIVPFAHTARYDKWVWVLDEDNTDYKVGLCEEAEITGAYYAKNTEDAILRNIIEYLASADFYIDKNDSASYQISEDELKKRIYTWKNQLTGIICDEYMDLIDSFTCINLKSCTHVNGDWIALLSYEERDSLIDKYIRFEMLDQEFPWFDYKQ